MREDVIGGARGLPVNFWLGIALSLIWSAVMTVVVLARGPEHAWSIRVQLADNGIYFAGNALGAAGLFELARRLGRGALGARIAAWGFVAACAVSLVSGLVAVLAASGDPRTLFAVMGWVWFAPHLAVLVGLALAARHRAGLALACVVISLLAIPPPPLSQPLYGWLHLGVGAAAALLQVRFAFGPLAYLVLAATAASAAQVSATPDPAAASGGLRTCGRALWMRVIAAVGVVLCSLMAMGVHGGGRGLIDFVRLATMTGAVLNVIALAWFGAGAARVAGSQLADVPRVPFALGAAASLWAAGASAYQASQIYRLLYRAAGEYVSRHELAEQAGALSVVLPLVVIGGVAILVGAIGAIAARRGCHELGQETRGKGIGFVALMLVSVAIQGWMIPKATSFGSFATMSLFAGGAALAATVLMAKLCTLAGAELEREPGLPEARVV